MGEVDVARLRLADDGDAVDEVGRVTAVGDPELLECLSEELERLPSLRAEFGDRVERIGRDRDGGAPGDGEQPLGVEVGQRRAVLHIDGHDQRDERHDDRGGTDGRHLDTERQPARCAQQRGRVQAVTPGKTDTAGFVSRTAQVGLAQR